MSAIRKLALLAGMAVAALALTAGTASAQETEVEVVEEQGHVPCVDCPIRMTGEQVFSDSIGNPLTTCEDEFEGTINADGSGELEWTPSPHGEPGCNVTNCIEEPGEDHWPIYKVGELGNGEEHIFIDFCLRNTLAQVDSHCPYHEVHIADESQHHYILTLEEELCQTAIGPVLITGQWEIESSTQHPALELEHHDE